MSINIVCTLERHRTDDKVVYRCKSRYYDQQYGMVEGVDGELQRKRCDAAGEQCQFWDIPTDWKISWQ